VPQSTRFTDKKEKIMGRFDNKTAVITGGASGIGLATAELFAAEGATVVIAGRDAVKGAAAVAALGGSTTFVQTDVGDDAQVAALAAAAAARTGTIDIWFSNAGYEGPIGAFDGWTDESITELLNTNVKGVLSGLRHASAHMKGSGVIVNTASFIGTTVPVPIAVAYGATKAAVISAGRHTRLRGMPLDHRHTDAGAIHRQHRTGRQAELRRGPEPERQARGTGGHRGGGRRPRRRAVRSRQRGSGARRLRRGPHVRVISGSRTVRRRRAACPCVVPFAAGGLN
jgi:NAD(P)-dependent dehydrogenase (short-subunit alcohol dehydrogenase family)